MRKYQHLLFLSAIQTPVKLLVKKNFLSVIFILLLPFCSVSQSSSEFNRLTRKAQVMKFRVEYDSSLYYYQNLKDLISTTGDDRLEIMNRIDLADIYVLRREYENAKTELSLASAEIASIFPDDGYLLTELWQVKGSLLLAEEQLDSAKQYFFDAIRIKTSLFGQTDTSLHYAYNKLGNLYLLQSLYDSAVFCHQFALKLSLLKLDTVNFLSASSYQNLGIAAHRKGDYKLAELCYTKSLEFKEKLFDENDQALAKIYGNLGKFFFDLSNYEMALYYYDKSEKSLLTRYDRNDILFAHLYWNKGNVYTQQGDYFKATTYLSKAYSIFINHFGQNNQDVSKLSLDFGFAYEKKGDFYSAIEYYRKAAANKSDAGIIKIYRNLGNIYQKINEADSADKFYKLSITYASHFFSGNSFDLALCYQYYGEFLANNENDGKSMEYYAMASSIFEQIFGHQGKDLANVYLLESRYYLKQKNYNDALKKIQSALITLLPSFKAMDPRVNPSIDEIVFDLYLPNVLDQKALILAEKYKQSKDLEDLKSSLETIYLTLAVIEEIRKTYTEEESQFILNNEARNLIDDGVKITHKLYTDTGNKQFLAESFHFSEKGQSIILLSALRGLKAQSTIDIPKSSQDYENNLLRDLATYNNLLYQEKQKKKPDDTKIQIWSDLVFSLGLAYDSVMNSYEKLYPDFFRLKYNYSTITADSVISCLPEDQVMIEYHLSDSAIYSYMLTNKELLSAKYDDRNVFNHKIDSFIRQFIRNDYFNADQQQLDALISLSTYLYDALIRPFEEEIRGKRIIIVPDGQLGYLSFDLLIDAQKLGNFRSYNELPWLIKSNPISYSSSATIYFEQMRSSTEKVSSDLLAFAPSYDFNSLTRDAGTVDSVRMKLSPITGIKEEIHSIAGMFRTEKRFDGEATEDYFKKHAGNYGILHLAMHTVIDNKNPLYSKLVFSPPGHESKEDGYLNTFELFRLHLPARLAVLSACNTGIGKLEKGEGIISLARGFFYAGIPSVLMTLWEIEDHSSADLMALFYEYLKKGYPNDIALQKAKITYLENSGKLQAHPYFWAGYVCLGKTSPIEFQASKWHFSYLIIGCILLIIIVLTYLFINNRVFFHKKRN